MSLNSTVTRVKASVVKIQVKSGSGRLIDSGTGFAVADDTVATCYHVLDPDECGKHHSPTINGVEWKVEKVNRARDIALLRGNMTFDPLTLRGDGDLAIGDEVIFLGFPAGIGNLTVHKGMVSAMGNGLLQRFKDIDLIQIDGSVNLGNSGGPAIDVGTGDVVGIVTAKYGPFLGGVLEFRDFVASFEQQPENEIGIGGIDWGKLVNLIFKGFLILAKPLVLVQVGIGYAIPSKYINELMED